MCDGVEPGHRMHYHPRAQTWMDNYWATSISESRNVNLKRPRWKYRSDRAGDKEVRVNYNRNPGKYWIGSLTCNERMSNFNQSSWGTWVCSDANPTARVGLGLEVDGIYSLNLARCSNSSSVRANVFYDVTILFVCLISYLRSWPPAQIDFVSSVGVHHLSHQLLHVSQTLQS